MKRLLLVLSLVAVIVTSTVLANPASALAEDVSDEVVQGLENGGDSGSGAQAPVEAADEQANAQGNEAAPSSDPQETLAAPSADQGVMNANSVSAVDSAAVTENGTGDSGIAAFGAEADGTEKSADQISAAEGSGTAENAVSDTSGSETAEQGATLAEAAETVSTEEAAAEKTTGQAAQSETDVLSFADDRAQVKIARKDGTGFPSDTTMSGCPLGTDDWNRVLSAVSSKVKAQSDDSTAYSVAGLHTWTLSLQAGDGSAASYDDIRAEAEFQGGLNDAGYATKTSEKEENGTDGTSITTASYETSWRVYAISGDSIADPVEDHLTDLTDADGTSLSVDENGALQSAAFDGSLPETVVFAQIVRETVTTGTEKKKEIPMPAVTFDREVATDHGTIMVHIEADEGTFEQGTTMSVKRVSSQDIIDKAIEAAGGRGSAAAVDISFRKADGTETEPAKPIRVKMTAKVLGQADKVHVVHVDDTGSTDVVAKKSDGKTIESTSSEAASSDAKNAVSFESDSFSVYAIVYTVDFEYSVNGKMYQFSLHGGEKITLSDLVEVLGIIDDTNNGEKATFNSVDSFLKEVADVEFSDESLVKVTPVEGDWELESLKPFSTDETLTVTMIDGQQFIVQVTDENSYSSALADFVSSVTINADKEDGKYVIKPGKTYSAYISFKEDPDGKQFSDHLEYTFPDGFNPDATSGTFTIIAKSKGVEYPVEGCTYRVENGKLIIDLNKDSPNYKYVASSSNSTINLNIEGGFDKTKELITWSDKVSTDIKLDLDQGVSIEKSITSFDPATGIISYRLKVKSLNGTNTDIVVSDHMNGTAVAINQDVLLDGATMSDGVTYTRLGDGDQTVNGFSFTIPSMSEGQEATVTYTATIDKEKMIDNKVNLYWDGNNSVTATPKEPGKPDSDAQNLRNVITAPTLTKGATVSDAVNGKRTITWTIEATSPEYFSLAGQNITDTIQAASRADMKYSGDGLTIVVTGGNGISETRRVPWSAVGVKNLNSDYTWTYKVPTEDTGNRTYHITYTTEVDVSDFVTDTVLKNDVEDPYKTNTGSIEVGPDGEDKKALLDKKVGVVSLEDIEWSVDITVPTQGLNKAQLTDDLPNQGDGTYTYHDTLKGSENDVQVTGLIEGQEQAEINYSKTNYQMVINFKKLVNGEWVDGLIGGDAPRTITVSFKTNNDQDWITAAETKTWMQKHTNNVKFEANRQVLTDSATGTPMKSSFTKKAENSGEVTVNGEKLPIYYYTISLTGVTGPFEITDSFDRRLIPVEVSLYSEQGKVCGGDQDSQGNAGSELASFESNGDGSMIIHVTKNSLAKNGTGYYSHYKILYALRVKDAEALESLKAEAAASRGGKITLTNKAESPYGSDEAEVTFENKALNKELLNKDALGESTNIGEFRITVNPDGYDLDPDSDMITLTDRFSNTLSIDYNTIKVEPAEGATWYASKNVVTFTLPDETPLVITYKAKVIGYGSIHFENTAEINEQKAIISDTKYIKATAGGTSSNYGVKILKHKRYDFTEVLGGAQFGLYTLSDREPVKDNHDNPVTFTTDENGIAYVEGSQDKDGWSIHPGTRYYLQELKAPEGYNLSTTQYEFQINADDTPDYDKNIYCNGDTLHIYNTPKGGLEVKKSVYGTELDDSQKNAIVFTVTKPDGTTVSKKYSEFTNGKWKLTDLPVGTYTVTETCGEVDGYKRTTSYFVDGDGASTTEGQTAKVEITDPSKETSVTFINKYKSTVVIKPETLQLKVQKNGM